MYVFLYIHNKYTQYTHILCKQKRLLWMRLITINHFSTKFNLKLTKTELKTNKDYID